MPRACDEKSALWFRQVRGVFPALLFVVLFVFVPLIYALYASMVTYRWATPANFCGFYNYIQISRLTLFLNTFIVTLKLLGYALPMVIVVSFAIALILDHPFPGNTLIMISLLIPYAIPGSIDAAMWRWLYDPASGIIQHIMEKLGILPKSGSLLGDPERALFAVIFAYVWKFVPYTTFIFLAGLKSIPKEYYDAARLECGAVKTFWYITFPLLKPVLFVALSLQTIFVLTMHFSLVYVLTGGGPISATTTLAYFVFLRSFEDLNFGQGSALAILLALIMLILICVYYMILTKEKKVVW